MAMTSEERLVSIFPGLAGTPFTITSPCDPGYNCIAWAAGDSSRWWEPDPFGDYYWPPTATREYSLEAYKAAFRHIGYSASSDVLDEQGTKRIALYANGVVPTHAARQIGAVVWTSKLGQNVDISHQLDGLEGSEYGKVAVIMTASVGADSIA